MLKRIMTIILLMILVLPIGVNAERFCSSKKYSKLKTEAYKVELSYEFFKEDDDRYFLITATDVGENIIIKYNGTIYEPTKDNDKITIQNKVYGGATYEINLYGGFDTDCVEEFLYTKKIAIPKYNIYSEREECIEYEEFELCQKWYQGEINNDEQFLRELEIYIESLKPKEEKKDVVEEKGFFENIISFYTDNIIITLPVTIIIVLLIIYKVVVSTIRRKNRIKIEEKL